jgi:pilus assembly protein CpaC
MKSLFFIFLAILWSLTSFATGEIYLSLGGEKSLPLGKEGTVWIQDGKVVRGTPSGRSLTLKGLKEGASLVKIGETIYSVQVLNPLGHSQFEKLSQKVKKIVGLKLVRKNGKLIVQGQLYRWVDWAQLKNLLEDVQYTFAAQVTPRLREEIQKEFSRLIQEAHLPAQSLIFDPQAEVRLIGSELYFAKYKQLLSPYGVELLKDENSLELAPTIKVQITVAEIRRDLHMQYGLKWPDTYSARILPQGLERTEDLIFNGKALEESGHGKILASPNIICRSGKEAEFLAGGEFPIKILNYKVQDIVWKRYGILLRVKPKADSAGRISLSIETEISTIDKSTAVDGVPGLLTNRVSSHFDLTQPRTIALSGLIKNEDGTSSAGIPYLSRVPILGPLFSSKDFQEKRTELVIFVRPSILSETESDSAPKHLRSNE